MTEFTSPDNLDNGVRSLLQYANQFDVWMSATYGFTFADHHTDDCRALAERVTRHVTSGEGVFADKDLELLKGIGTHLVHLGSVPVGQLHIDLAARRDASSKLSLGNDILALNEYVRAHLRPLED